MKPKRWTKRERELFNMGILLGVLCMEKPQFSLKDAGPGRCALAMQGDDETMLLINQFETAEDLKAVITAWVDARE